MHNIGEWKNTLVGKVESLKVCVMVFIILFQELRTVIAMFMYQLVKLFILAYGMNHFIMIVMIIISL